MTNTEGRTRTRTIPERRLEMATYKVADLTEDPNNVKVHTEGQVATVTQSILQFGFNDPIGIRPDGQIVEGHGRRLAAIDIGLEEVPVIILHGFTEREYQLYAIAHNKLTLATPHDGAKLRAELTRIFAGQEEFDYESLGFTDKDINWSELNPGSNTGGEGGDHAGNTGQSASGNRAASGGTTDKPFSTYELVFDDLEEHDMVRDWLDKGILHDGNKDLTAAQRILRHHSENKKAIEQHF